MTLPPGPSPQPERLGRDLLWLALALALLFGALIDARPLAPPSEGRYAEIPREMLESGDFITPRLNGIKYFEKPPLFYWLQSASLAVLGGSEGALRFWPAAMAGLGCLAVFVAAARFWNRRSAWLAAGLLATSALWFGLSRQIVLDMTVTVFLTVALLAFINGANAPPERQGRLFYLMYAMAALATLTKGLIGIVIPGAVVFFWLAFTGRWNVLLKARLPTGLLLFLLITVPWHWLAARANPEFAQFYFVHEHFERFTSRVHDRYAPPWFFVPVLLGGLLPWLPLLPAAMATGCREAWIERKQDGVALFLIIWAVTVFLFFSASSSKLVPYILPCLPPIALLMARYADGTTSGLTPALWATTALIAALGFIFATGALGIVDPLLDPLLARNPKLIEPLAAVKPVFWPLALAALTGSLLAAVFLWRSQAMAAIGVLVVATGLVWVEAEASSGPFIERSAKPLAQALQSRLRADDEVIAYRDYLQDFTYYIGRRMSIVGWQGELTFGSKQEDVSSFMINDDVFRQRWLSDRRVFAVTSISELERLQQDLALPVAEIARTRRHVLLANPAASGAQ